MGLLNQLKGQASKNQGNDGRLRNVAKFAIPVILYGLYKNSNNKEEKEKLERALKDHELREEPRAIEAGESKRMVDHIFRGQGASVSKSIAEQTGVSQEEVERVLENLTPSIMQDLAKSRGQGEDISASMEREIEDLKKDQDYGQSTIDKVKGFIESPNKDGSLLSDLAGTIFKHLG